MNTFNMLDDDNTMDDYFNSTFWDADEVEEVARGVTNSSNSSTLVLGDFAEKALGVAFCGAIIATAVYLAHMNTISERAELAAAEQQRVAQEKEKQQEEETYRGKIAKVIESYAIHLTRITSSVLLSRHDSEDIIVSDDIPDNVTERTTSMRQVLSGSDDELSIKSGSNEEVIIDFEAAVSMDNDTNDTNNNDEVIDLQSRAPCDTTSTMIDTENKIQDEESPTQPPLSSSSRCRPKITEEILLDAVIGNPCAICLEPFGPGDDIVCCSNSVDGGKPHIFHKSCSYDYIINHTEGMQAPCPTCRRRLVPSKKKRKACFKHIHTQTLTMPDDVESIVGSDDASTTN